MPALIRQFSGLLKIYMNIGILDDYQSAALNSADWSSVLVRAKITVFSNTIDDQDALAARLAPFDILCVMRERTPLDSALLARLPNLKLIASTGPQNAAIDADAARARGIEIAHTGYFSEPTVEMTWAIIHAVSRNIVDEVNAVRAGQWQQRVGSDLHGRTLGLLGLGNVGGAVARVGLAFGMNVIAWSDNLTAEKAAIHGVSRVSKDRLFEQSDILSIHTILSSRTRGLVNADVLAQMKSSAYLINTSRGPIVDERALIDSLRDRRIAGAALDVFDVEPLPKDHPFRTLDNVLATPHLGYVSQALYRTFYGDSARNIAAWLDAHNA